MDSYSPAVVHRPYNSFYGWTIPDPTKLMDWDARHRVWIGDRPNGGIMMEVSNEVVEQHLARLMEGGKDRVEATHLVRSCKYWSEIL